MPCCYDRANTYPFCHLETGCQFDVPESDLISIGMSGEKWCKYHLPFLNSVGAASNKLRWNDGAIENFNWNVFSYIEKCIERGEAINMAGVIFPDHIDFAKRFYETNLTAANFSNCYFNRGANFSGITFSESTSFESAEFKSITSFKGSNFQDLALFQATHFSSSADFSGVVFKGPFVFVGQDIDENIEGTVVNSITFSEAIFKGFVDFSDRSFRSPANFEFSNFSVAPIFHGAKLHQGTSFRGTSFADFESEHAPESYRTIKQAMETVRDLGGMAKFYAYEQKSIRHQSDTPKQVKLMS